MMPANEPLWTAPSTDSPVEATDKLAQAYFRHVGPEDQRVLGEQGRDEMVQCHLELAVKAAGKPKIAIRHYPRHAVIQVVHPDIRFLVDSVSAELNKMDIPISVVVNPIVVAQHADDDGQLTDIFELPAHPPRISGDRVMPLEQIPPSPKGYHAELQSWISIQTGIPLQPEQAELLVTAIEASLSDVRA